MRTCSRCLLPETQETWSLDGEGICSVCRAAEFKANIDWADRKLRLNELVKLYRGKGSYDALVPFSGGKDSAFTLFYLAKEYGLKMLAVTFDHGFFRPQHIERQYQTIRAIGADWLRVSLNWKVQKEAMLIALRRRGDFCWPCHCGCFAVPAQVSIEKHIPLVIYGEPQAEYTAYGSYEGIEKRDSAMFHRFINLGITAEDMTMIIGCEERELSPLIYPTQEKLDAAGYLGVCLGSFIPWDTKTQSDTIKKEIGWKGDVVEGAPSDIDKVECMLQGARDFCAFVKRGRGRTAHQVALELRRGRITTEDAKVLIAQYDGKRPASLDFLLERLGISETEFMEILKTQVVAPHEYRSEYPKGEELQDECEWRAYWPDIDKMLTL